MTAQCKCFLKSTKSNRIMITIDYKICKKAVETFGADQQINMAIEEMAELIVALNHWRRGRCGNAEVIEEIADSTIMMVQLSYIICSTDFSPINKVTHEKLERLAKTIRTWQLSTSTE